MNALFLDEATMEDLNSLKDYAHEHPYTVNDMLDIRNGVQLAPGDQPEFVRYIPLDYRLVLTVELQEYTMLHLSMSKADGKLPHPLVVQMVMDAVGFKTPLRQCIVAIEAGWIINVIEQIGTKPNY